MNGKIPRPTGIPKKNFSSVSTFNSNALRKSPGSNSNAENRATTSHLVRQQTGISGTTNSAPRRDLLRRSKSYSTLPPASLKQPVTIFRKPLVSTKRPAAPTTSVSTVGASAPKQPRVKIAPYDYKARYNDLFEKNTALKDKFSKLDERCRAAEELASINANLLKDKTSELNALSKANSELNKNYSELQNLFETVNTKHDLVQDKYLVVESKLKQSELLLEELEKTNAEYATKVLDLSNDQKKMMEQILTLQEKLLRSETLAANFKESLQASHAQRKIMHNTISDLRGNIRVFCRIRPPLPSEEAQELCNWNYPDECSVNVIKSTLPKSPHSKIPKHEFKYDMVFPPSASQQEIFFNVECLVQSALDGFNVCIFAYGQTGSGKTYTMEGNEHNMGLIPRSVNFIFDQIALMEPIGWSFNITASFVEIYNEQIRDLLNNSDHDFNHEIKLVDGKQNEVYVSNIQDQIIKNANDLKKLLHIAQRNRVTAQTDSNERSSRSHSVVKITISSINSSTAEMLKGTLNLVDLAGSESPKTSLRMDETKNINKSLSQLGKVILSLQQKQEHIPYRNSKLTFLLMPCLGGRSKTLMFVNVNPLVSSYSETVNSLRFASQVNQVKTLKAQKNKTMLKPKVH